MGEPFVDPTLASALKRSSLLSNAASRAIRSSRFRLHRFDWRDGFNVILYHGSPRCSLQSLRPGKNGHLSATPDFRLALTFMIVARVFCCGRIENLEYVCLLDNGLPMEDNCGALYLLSSDRFKRTDTIDGLEWITTDTVVPIQRFVYASVFTTLYRHGIHLFGLQEDLFRDVEKGTASGLNRLLKLSPLNKHI